MLCSSIPGHETVLPVVPIYESPVCVLYAQTTWHPVPSPESDEFPSIMKMQFDSGSSDIVPASISEGFNIGLGGSTWLFPFNRTAACFLPADPVNRCKYSEFLEPLLYFVKNCIGRHVQEGAFRVSLLRMTNHYWNKMDAELKKLLYL